MRIWVDAHSCPEPVLRIVYQAANREQVPAILVGGTRRSLPRSPFVSSVRVSSVGEAEKHFLVLSPSGRDVVITSNLPIAEALLEKGIAVLHPRGLLLSRDNLAHWPMPQDDAEEAPPALPLRGEPDPQSAIDTKAFSDGLEKALSAALESLSRG